MNYNRQSSYGRHQKRSRGIWKKLLGITVLIALAIGLWMLMAGKDQPPTPSSSKNNKTETEKKKEEPEKKLPPLVDVQPVIDAWAAKQSGKASVVVYDLENKKTVGQLNPHEQYFAASIYKLYVAYMGYQKVADGTYSMDESYLGGWTRGKCLDEMIRTSHSPCGEKMWAELGKEKLTEQLKSKYGLTDTSMVGLTTSAQDAAIILQRMHERRDLSDAYTDLYLDSMKNQIYRDVLPKGFTNSTVYDKVGFNLNLEYHDVAIVTLPNNRNYVVSILTRSVGTRQMVSLAQSLQTALTQ